MDELPLTLPPSTAPTRPELQPLDPDLKRRTGLAAGLALLWAAFTLLAQFSGALNTFEEPLLDWRQTFKVGSAASSDQLALIAIDNVPPERPWPWSRFDYALALRSLIDYHPQSVVFEMNLNDRDTEYAAFDDTFSHTVDRAHAVIFAATLLTAPAKTPAPNLVNIPTRGDTRLLPRYSSALWPSETFSGHSAVGANNVESESGYIRRVPLVFLLDGKTIPSLVLQSVATYLGADLATSDLQIGRAIFLRRADGKLLRTIPVDNQGRLRIRFHHAPPASWQASFDNVLVYDDLLQHNLKPDHDLRELNNRQVWIGRTDPANRSRYKTPLGVLSRTEIGLQAERTILNQDYVRPLPPIILAALYLLIAIGASVLLVRLGPRRATGLFLLLAVSWLGLSVLAFRIDNVILPLPSFAFLLLGAYIVGLLALYWDLEPEEDPRQTKLDLES